MWDPSSPARDRVYTPCTESQCLNHWITREVPKCIFDLSYLQQIVSFSKFDPIVSPGRSVQSGTPPPPPPRTTAIDYATPHLALSSVLGAYLSSLFFPRSDTVRGVLLSPLQL